MSMLLLYDSLLAKSGVTLTADSEAAGFPVANAADWLDHDAWKPAAVGTHYIQAAFAAAQAADTLAIYGHDLATQGSTVNVKRYDSGAWTQVATVTPSSDGIVVLRWASVSDTQWRIEVVDANSTPYIAVAFLGAALVLPDAPIGFAPPLVPGVDASVNRAMNGALLGAFERPKAADIKVHADLQTPSWIRSYWKPFMQHAARKPFIFCWDSANLAESWYCWCEKPLPQPEYTQPTYQRAVLECRATDGL